MNGFTLDDAKRILRTCAGEDDTVDLEGDILHVSFTDLGYDSLALLETAAIVEREYGVALPEDGLQELDTPGKLIDFVNKDLTARV
ncbi:acyl carrier protein [Streptomyces nondiastaticus]|uniref:acyl carrier protein n=1 Tax=Streptomyces nondiastaticus TaxID=3154512 RepID=UPI0034165D19